MTLQHEIDDHESRIDALENVRAEARLTGLEEGMHAHNMDSFNKSVKSFGDDMKEANRFMEIVAGLSDRFDALEKRMTAMERGEVQEGNHRSLFNDISRLEERMSRTRDVQIAKSRSFENRLMEMSDHEARIARLETLQAEDRLNDLEESYRGLFHDTSLLEKMIETFRTAQAVINAEIANKFKEKTEETKIFPCVFCNEPCTIDSSGKVIHLKRNLTLTKE